MSFSTADILMSHLQKKTTARLRVLFSSVMICVGVPWLPSLCATDSVYNHIYKLYSNYVVSIDVGKESEGWYIGTYGKDIFSDTRSAQGNFPIGLNVIINNEHCVDNGFYDYLLTSYTLTGKICAASVKQTPLTTYIQSMHYYCETYFYVNNAWVLQYITDNQVTCNHHFFCDDFADGPADTTNVGTLAVQSTWSANNGWTEGHVQAEVWDSQYHMPADVDVLRVAIGQGVYCVETEKQFVDFDAALIVSVFKKQADANEYDGDCIARTNKFNVYNDHGYIDNVHQRVYFTLDNDNGAYVQIGLADPSKASNYKVRVFRARPVILVHGIDSKPWTQAEARAGKNTMGNWEDCLPWDANAYPCVCYNFAWDSAQDNLLHDDEGKIVGIIQQDPSEADNPNVDKVYHKHNMDVVLIGHSMGGFIVRYALNDDDSRSMIYKAVLLGSPMYGSDIALGPVVQPIPWLKNTSAHNLRMLRRGSIFASEMHSWPGAEECLCIAGQGAPPRVRIPFIPYERGLGHSDGVVPVSSALLVGADNRIFSRNHGTVGLATYEIGRQNKPAVFQDAIYKTVRDAIK